MLPACSARRRTSILPWGPRKAGIRYWRRVIVEAANARPIVKTKNTQNVFEGKIIREAHMFRPTCLIAAAWLSTLAPAAAQTPPAAGVAVDAAAIEELVVANRILAERGIIDAYGHVSMRHPGNPNRYLMARALAPALVTAADIMEFDLDSNPVDRRGRSMFTERYIHGEAYKLRPDVNGVVHTHSMGVIPFAVTQVPLKPVIHTASFLHVGVPVWEIREAGGVTNMLVSSPKLGQALAATLGAKPVALM